MFQMKDCSCYITDTLLSSNYFSIHLYEFSHPEGGGSNIPVKCWMNPLLCDLKTKKWLLLTAL